MDHTHATNAELKACPTCFPVAPEVNCMDCAAWQRAYGIVNDDYGICQLHVPGHTKRVHRNSGCSLHSALHGKS